MCFWRLHTFNRKSKHWKDLVWGPLRMYAGFLSHVKGHIMQTKRETRTGVNKQLLMVKFQLDPLDLRSWSLLWPTALMEMINTRDDSLFF